MSIRIGLTIIATALVSLQVTAMSKEDMATSLKGKVPFTIKAIEDSPLDGFYQIITNKGLMYVDHDGKHIITGNIFSVSGELTNLTQIRKQKMNIDLMNEFLPTAITYPAQDEKYSVTVFTDIDCKYCKRMHRQVQEYNDLGITMNFLAYPRNGTDSSTFKKMETIWCKTDKVSALDMAIKDSYNIPMNATCVNPVEAHYNLGRSFGVKGTPAVYSSDANLLSAYVGPKEMLDKLENK